MSELESAADPSVGTATDGPAPFAWRLVVEYDGTGYAGWQAQPGRPTVEAALQRALELSTGERPRLAAAGRTDAGAHAHGQVISLALRRGVDPERLRAACNANLPKDIVVRRAEPVGPDFHARFSARRRVYRYLVDQGGVSPAVGRHYVWHVTGPLDLAAMRQCAADLCGRHDLRAFGQSPRPGGHTVRTIHHLRIRRIGRQVVFEVTADAFLRGMLRSLVGALVAVGTGRIPAGSVRAAVERPDVPRPPWPVAPARGIHQWAVEYEEGPQP